MNNRKLGVKRTENRRKRNENSRKRNRKRRGEGSKWKEKEKKRKPRGRKKNVLLLEVVVVQFLEVVVVLLLKVVVAGPLHPDFQDSDDIFSDSSSISNDCMCTACGSNRDVDTVR